MTSLIDDGAISAFLQQQNDTHGDVLGWTYASVNMASLIRVISPHNRPTIKFGGATGYKTIGTELHSLQENYLSVVSLKYFYPTEVEDDLKQSLPKLRDG